MIYHPGRKLKILSSALFMAENNESYTAKWTRNRISNLEYMLAVNKAAGRSILDCSRYYIMPWCIKSYDTAVIKLNEEIYYRDMSKPIGLMLDNERAAAYQDNYSTMVNDKEPFPYYFGTYISNCTSVLQYLMRIEPVTQSWKAFFGRVHESPERIFYSLLKHYRAITTSSQDLKEAIPEFYYMPECFININRFGLVEKPSENWRIDTVELPKWSKQNPYHFVYLNRIILESEIVSRMLPGWIDLIFGINQQGKNAIHSKNVYQPSIYPDSALKLFKEADKKGELLALYSQIYFFGQCPSQLFIKPHSKKVVLTGPLARPNFGARPLDLQASSCTLKENSPPPTILLGIDLTDSTLTLITSHNCLQYKVSRQSLLCRLDKQSQVNRLASRR